MWLIDVKTYELKNLVGEHVWHMSPYAILSHTWGEDEVTFEDMKNLNTARRKPAFSKIAVTCRLAETKKLKFAWIDTCCIDKSSSAELQEAINSMSKWYSDANVCYAYLSDVDQRALLPYSRWFSRGWTLQELLMPKDVIFLGSEWQFLGTKYDMRIAISRVTGIDSEVLDNRKRTMDLKSISVAKRMSWAANRQTTRVEDQAYSLLGIFNVSMPLLYGEGNHAFQRLQEEIFKTTADLSLFLWQFDSQMLYTQLLAVGRDESQCLLAPYPSVFENCRHIKTATTDYSRAATRSLSTIGLAARMSVLTKHAQQGAPFGADRLLLLDCFDERYPQYTIALRASAKKNLFCSPIYSDEHGRTYAKRLERVDVMEVLEETSEEDIILLRSSEYVTANDENVKQRMIRHHDGKEPAFPRAEPGVDFVWIHSIEAAGTYRRVHQRKTWPQKAWHNETFDATKCYDNRLGDNLSYLCGAMSYEVEPQDIIVAIVVCIVGNSIDADWPKQHYKLVECDFMSVDSDTDEALKSCCLQFISNIKGESITTVAGHDMTGLKSYHIPGRLFEFAVKERITQFGGNSLAVLDVKIC